jgi:hypothetical protein
MMAFKIARYSPLHSRFTGSSKVHLGRWDAVPVETVMLAASNSHAPRPDSGGPGELSAIMTFAGGVAVVKTNACRSCHYDGVLVKITNVVRNHVASDNQREKSQSRVVERQIMLSPGRNNENPLSGCPNRISNQLSTRDAAVTSTIGILFRKVI